LILFALELICIGILYFISRNKLIFSRCDLSQDIRLLLSMLSGVIVFSLNVFDINVSTKFAKKNSLFRVSNHYELSADVRIHLFKFFTIYKVLQKIQNLFDVISFGNFNPISIKLKRRNNNDFRRKEVSIIC